MLNILFFASLVLYFAATLLEIAGTIFKINYLKKVVWGIVIAAFTFHTAYAVIRGVKAGRIPMSNQFEFAMAFAWGITLVYFLLKIKNKQMLIEIVTLPLVFLVMSYAALLPKEITDLMPALRSAWFSLHIGAAVFSYSFFLIAAAIAIKYLISIKKGIGKDDPMLIQIDTLSYRLTASGFLLLTVVILSGCIWAEQAWSTFWSWDPKETWALITWLLYALYLHLRIKKKWKGTRIAWFSIIAIICVVFTFVGVNQLLPSLHSYK